MQLSDWLIDGLFQVLIKHTIVFEIYTMNDAVLHTHLYLMQLVILVNCCSEFFCLQLAVFICEGQKIDYYTATV